MPRQERAERTRVAILDAAAAEFDEYGYDGARLDRIVQRTGATKGAVYFHFQSKLDLARALVEEKYANWPVVVAQVTGSGLRGIDAAEEITQRVAEVFVTDIRVRAAMKLTQTVLPPSADDNPYDKWTDLIAVFLEQELEEAGAAADARALATVAVHGFFGAYMIADELGRLSGLAEDVKRLWAALRLAIEGARQVDTSRSPA